MTEPVLRLGIDFGTSTTVAVLRRPDGRTQQLLFDGSPLLASAVLLGPDGRLHTGRDAAHLARSAPHRLEPNPKRRIDEPAVLLGDDEVTVGRLITAVLTRIAAEADRVAAAPVRAATLTHPVGWGPQRRATLVAAARRAGLTEVGLVAEPLAAAAAFTAVHGGALADGTHLLVFDLGAGTCDVSLLRRDPYGFEPVADDGRDDIGGLDVDAAIVTALQETFGQLWTDAASRLRLWDEVRSAKEMLSRASGTVVALPSLGREVPFGREQLEAIARPVLWPAVAMTAALLRTARVSPADVGGVFLVGGSSRIPLVATMLHETLGIAPVVAEQPELVVAEGALRLGATGPASDAWGLGGAEPAPEPTPEPAAGTGAEEPISGWRYGGVGPIGGGQPFPRQDGGAAPADVAAAARRRWWRAGLAAAAVVVLAFGVFAIYLSVRKPEGTGTAASPSAAGLRYDLAKTPDNLCPLIYFQEFMDLYDGKIDPDQPGRNLTGQLGSANCHSERIQLHGTARVELNGSISVRPDNEAARRDYQQVVAGTARVNDTPAPVDDLGDEAVVYQLKDSSQKASTEITIVLGVRQANLVWILRVRFIRTDKAGWDDGDRQMLCSRLVQASWVTLKNLATALT
ncbi:Hsp70 family protein [Dactylosporangium sp. NPDC051485]|uniref:Hsp70 family protein n=1 Tax=Dactylosporangium sp. NPDC051485 TaxID=3154846 RepID=UPI0034291890